MEKTKSTSENLWMRKSEKVRAAQSKCLGDFKVFPLKFYNWTHLFYCKII